MNRLCFFFLLAVTAYSETPREQFERVKTELLSLKADETMVADVRDLQLKRDAGLFRFRSGNFYGLSAVNGTMHGLLFVGEGTFECTPPTEVERKQLYRFYEKESFSEEIQSVFFLFTDSTFSELSASVKFRPASVPENIDSRIETSVKFIWNYYRTGIMTDIFRTFLLNEQNDFFYSQVTTKDNDPYFFIVDPNDIEEITLARQTKQTTIIAAGYGRETICQFHRQGDYTGGKNLSEEKKPYLEVFSYSMNNSFDDDLDFTSQCSLTFKNLKAQSHWLPFDLYYKLEIDSVFLNGRNVSFFQEDKSYTAWIGFDQALPAGEELTLTFYYHGELIDQQEGWYSLKTSLYWYPHPIDERHYTTFDLTFHTPVKYKFAGIGKKISDSIENDDNRVTRWVLNTPGRNASFFIGSYEEYTATPDGLPPITVYTSSAHDERLKNYLASKMILSGADMEKQIAIDVENSLNFFQKIYGKKNLDHFYVAEIPDLHGESFPGLIHLAWSTFQSTESDGSDEVFRAHEVAHQWWAADVDFCTYHDQWISEAFAEYSGLWYMQMVLQDNQKFFDMLQKYKESILSNRKYIFGRGQEAGPVWLGYRTQSTETRGDYNLIIYKKGAWILHMLRNMALDLKTMNEDAFKETMKDFYTTYSGRQASTDDFQKVVEKHFGVDMSWFFRQWVYGTDIPVYDILYTLTEQPDGKYRVHCTVKQTNVPEDFQMYVPFKIDFGENRFARLRYLIKGPTTEFDFPVLPLKPEEIKFNDLESVLCEIDDEDWE